MLYVNSAVQIKFKAFIALRAFKNDPAVGAICIFDAMGVLPVARLIHQIIFKITKNLKIRRKNLKTG